MFFDRLMTNYSVIPALDGSNKSGIIFSYYRCLEPNNKFAEQTHNGTYLFYAMPLLFTTNLSLVFIATMMICTRTNDVNGSRENVTFSSRIQIILPTDILFSSHPKTLERRSKYLEYLFSLLLYYCYYLFSHQHRTFLIKEICSG